jgi:hypothetical protein
VTQLLCIRGSFQLHLSKQTVLQLRSNLTLGCLRCVFAGIVLDDNDDIATSDDLYDVIGIMLEGLDDALDCETVQEICSLLFNTRKR